MFYFDIIDEVGEGNLNKKETPFLQVSPLLIIYLQLNKALLNHHQPLLQRYMRFFTRLTRWFAKRHLSN